MKFHAFLISLTCLVACMAAQADDKPAASLLQTMSAADFRAIGLDHLSDAQLKALDEWFANHTQNNPVRCPAPVAAVVTPPPAAVVPVPAVVAPPSIAAAVPAPAPVAAAQPTGQTATTATDDVIVAHLDGKFTGLSSGVRFKLDNGQVWEQVDDLTLTMGAMQNPKVTITKGAFNAHYLAIEGVSDTVMVRLLQP
jgi:hypothetical protein